MSHNSGALVPYITEHTTALSTAGAGQSLVIKGFGLGLSAVVDIPAALGVETARAFTKTGATAGTLTITLTVEAMPESATDRVIPISMGGVPCQGPDVTAGALTVSHGWEPTEIASLVAWFDAADYNSMTIDTDETSPGSGIPKNLVGQWNDKSGNGFHAVQNTESNKPKYFASGGGIGQKHVSLGHDGTALSWFVMSPSMTWATVSSGGYANCSVFAVLHWPGTSVGGDILRQSNGNNFSVNANYGIHFWAVNSNQAQGGTAGGSLPAEFLAGWFWTDSGFITRLNGSVDDTDSSSPVTSAQTSASNVLGLNFSTGTDMEIAELLIFNTELTGSDLSDVEDYLNAKWDIY